MATKILPLGRFRLSFGSWLPNGKGRALKALRPRKRGHHFSALPSRQLENGYIDTSVRRSGSSVNRSPGGTRCGLVMDLGPAPGGRWQHQLAEEDIEAPICGLAAPLRPSY